MKRKKKLQIDSKDEFSLITCARLNESGSSKLSGLNLKCQNLHQLVRKQFFYKLES